VTVPAVARHPYLVVMIHGFWSFVLFLLNFLCIVVIGVLTFWMKEVHGESHDHAAAYSARFAQRKGMLRSMWKQVRAGAKDIAKRGEMTRTEFARKKNSADVGDVAQHAGHGFKSTLQKLRDHADEHAGEGRHRPRELRPRTHGTRSETPIEPSPPRRQGATQDVGRARGAGAAGALATTVQCLCATHGAAQGGKRRRQAGEPRRYDTDRGAPPRTTEELRLQPRVKAGSRWVWLLQ